jgi:CMP-N-acetylneuraminic acid synthetase
VRTLGVIPARGGSKRVPRKNLRLLSGSPLISYTIEAAKKATKLTDWVVSTEDEEIENVALSYGARVLKRPDSLASDDTTSGAVCKHALEAMEADNEPYDMVVLLHPTSPIRDPKHIDEAVARLAASDCKYAASIRQLPTKRHPTVFNAYTDIVSNPVFALNASIYAIKRDELLAKASHTGHPFEALFMDRYHSLDIDEEIDLKIAELYLCQDR